MKKSLLCPSFIPFHGLIRFLGPSSFFIVAANLVRGSYIKHMGPFACAHSHRAQHAQLQICMVAPDRCPGPRSTEGLCQAGVDSICLSPFPSPPLPLLDALSRMLHTMAAHAIADDLLMDLIAFQLIAPHADNKLNQTQAPSTSVLVNLISLDIVIR